MYPPVGSGVLQQAVFIVKMLFLMPDVIFAANRADSVLLSVVNRSSFSERSCADLQIVAVSSILVVCFLA